MVGTALARMERRRSTLQTPVFAGNMCADMRFDMGIEMGTDVYGRLTDCLLQEKLGANRVWTGV